MPHVVQKKRWVREVIEGLRGIMQVLNTDFSPQAAAACMNRLAKLSARFIGDRGFSIGIDDVTPAPALLRAKQKLMTDGCDQPDISRFTDIL